MIDGRLAGWPIWLSVGIHAVSLVAVSSVVAVARHEPERVLVPVEVVRVEPPPLAPPEKPKMPPRLVAQPNRVTRATPTLQNLMLDPTPRVERTPDPAMASPDRRYMASADVPGAGLPIPGPAGSGGLCCRPPTSRARPAAARASARGSPAARGTASPRSPAHWAAIKLPPLPGGGPTRRRRRDRHASLRGARDRKGRHRAGAALRGAPGS